MQVAELEDSLGTPLFDRLPRGVRLTDAGQTLLGCAQRIATLEEEAERAMRELRGLARGRLALGASTTIGSYLLPAVLGQFRRRHPAVELQLTIANTDEIKTRLLDRTLDLGLTEGTPPQDEDLSSACVQRGRTHRHRAAEPSVCRPGERQAAAPADHGPPAMRAAADRARAGQRHARSGGPRAGKVRGANRDRGADPQHHRGYQARRGRRVGTSGRVPALRGSGTRRRLAHGSTCAWLENAPAAARTDLARKAAQSVGAGLHVAVEQSTNLTANLRAAVSVTGVLRLTLPKRCVFASQHQERWSP